MKLRQLVGDFQVEEINEFALSEVGGEYRLYLLEKKGLESFSILRYLSGKNNVPPSSFGVAGLKDRHAVTKQYFTIPSEYEIKTLGEKNFTITFLGYVSKEIRSGDLLGNKFRITVRDVREGDLDGVCHRAETIGAVGVPNYFDSQRFGSVIRNEFIVKHVIGRDYERAVKVFLTQYVKSEKKTIKDEKRGMLEHWDSIGEFEVRNPLFARIIGGYRGNKSWLDAYRRIPANLREMFVSAYQSYLWNECVKEVLGEKVDGRKLYPVKYNLGVLLFYSNLSDDEAGDIPETFKTISDKIRPSEFERNIISRVLSREGVGVEDFNIKKETETFFQTQERKVLVKPADFYITPPSIDELNGGGKKNRFKITLSFTLPKGSYATIITKRIFNK